MATGKKLEHPFCLLSVLLDRHGIMDRVTIDDEKYRMRGANHQSLPKLHEHFCALMLPLRSMNLKSPRRLTAKIMLIENCLHVFFNPGV
jgi:hypothetical protein